MGSSTQEGDPDLAASEAAGENEKTQGSSDELVESRRLLLTTEARSLVATRPGEKDRREVGRVAQSSNRPLRRR